MSAMMMLASVLFFIDYHRGSEPDIYPAVIYGIFALVLMYQGYNRFKLKESEEMEKGR